MKRLLASLILLCCLCLNGAHGQAGESRLALVIGNSSYKSSPLANPVNDARLMEAALKEAGFTVLKAENASIREMRRLVRDFGDRLKASGGVGLFYFAGHGLQVRGENYLVSVDSDIRNEDEVADDAINANTILEKMQTAGNRMNLIILDACRNNPFAVKSRSSSTGLATMNAPSGSLVAYSTAPGSVASDGTGNNGLYTMHLARAIRQQGLPVEEVFKQVRAAVRRESNNQQTPWENTALEGQFFFRQPAQVAPAPVAPPAPVVAPALPKPAGPDAATVELAFWDSIKASTNPAELDLYVKRYPNGIFTDLAKARIGALRQAAADRAAAEKSAADRAAAERAAVQAAAAAAPKPDPNAADIAFWDGIKISSKPAELEAYLAQFPNGLFAGLVKARLADLRAKPVVPAPTSSAATAAAAPQRPSGASGPGVPVAPVSPHAGAGTGRMTLKDQLSGKTDQMDVYVTSTDQGLATYSTGDAIAGHEVKAVRLGIYTGTLRSGSLWQLPLQPGASGSAVLNIPSMVGGFAEINWRVAQKNSDIASLEARVSFGGGNMGGAVRRSGTWSAQYKDDAPLPIWTKLEVRIVSGGATNPDIIVTEWAPAALTAPAAMAAPPAGTALGQMVLRNRLTNQTETIDVSRTILPDGAQQYSTGDEVAADGAVRALRIGASVYRVRSGTAWHVPTRAGSSGSFQAIPDGRNDGYLGVDWTITAAGQVECRLSEIYPQRTAAPLRLGRLTISYGAQASLPLSYQLEIREAMRGTGLGNEMAQAELKITGR